MTRAWDMASLMSNSSFGKIPSGTTANRPASPVVGDQYYNGTIGALEVYTSAGWKTATIAQGNTAGRPATPFAGQLYSNGELQRLELYTGALYGWQNIVAETPGVTGYTGNVLESNSTNTITITGTNFATGAVASLIGTDGTEYIANSTTVNNLTSITATFGAISAAKEPYDIKVTNPSNLYGVYYDVLTVNDTPIWSTSAGNLATFFDSTRSSVNIALSATDEENNTLTYSIVSGSLPSGVTLNSSTGVISGTAAAVVSDTTYSFVARVSDGSNTADRSFNIVVKAPIITTFTYTGSDQSYTLPAGASTFKAYIWGAGGGNYLASGFRGGGGGYTTGTVTSSSPGTSFVVVVGQGGESRGGNAGTGAKRYGGGGQLTSLGWGGQGGGLSGIFTGTSQVFNVNTPQTGAFARSVLIAGGGGGSGDVGWGGSGGGTSGRNIYTNTSGGVGSYGAGLQTDSNNGYNGATQKGGQLYGGDASGGDQGGGGGGGAGYYGGGGGSGDNGVPNSGGGGSGYIGGASGATVSNASTEQGSDYTPGGTSSAYYNSNYGFGAIDSTSSKDGRVVIVC